MAALYAEWRVVLMDNYKLELTLKELLYLKESIEVAIAVEEKHISTYESIIERKKDRPEQVEAGNKLIVYSKNKIEELNSMLKKMKV